LAQIILILQHIKTLENLAQYCNMMLDMTMMTLYPTSSKMPFTDRQTFNKRLFKRKNTTLQINF